MMYDKAKKRGMSMVSLKFVAGTLVILLVGSNIFSFVGASEGERVNCRALEFNQIQTPRASDIVNYTQMALDFVENYYPDKNYSMFNSSVRTPYPETGFSYQQIEIDITPGASSPFDTVIITIRHDTLNIEFGHAQYIQDYEDWCDALPPYYKKMESQYRRIIVENIGFLPNITDPITASFSRNFTFFYSESNEAELVTYLKDGKFNYSILEINDTYTYILSYMTLEDCLKAANQSFVREVGINIMGQWELNVIDSWHYDDQERMLNPIFFISIIGIIIVSSFFLYRRKRNQVRNSSEKKGGK